MLRILRADAFQQRQRLLRLVPARQAIAEMRADILVLRIALVGRAVTRLGLVELALAEIDVGQLQMMMRLVEMMDVGLQAA